MKKSNVTKNRERGDASPSRGSSPSNDSEIIGWLIFRPDTDEFLYSYKAGVGYSSASYTKEPAHSYSFESERLAFRYSIFIDKPTEVVPLFDLGDKLAVGFK